MAQRQLSKSRLSKQDEVCIEEVDEEEHSPSSDKSDATVVPTVSVESPGPTPESGSPDEPKSPPGSLSAQASLESDQDNPTSVSHPKVKLLVRSQALRDDASPPPEDVLQSIKSSSPTPPTVTTTNSTSVATATLTVTSATPKGQRRNKKLQKEGSSEGSGREGSADSSTSPCLSRNSSTESPYTDSTGIDLEEFIKMTLNKNPKDRMFLMKLEQDLANFISDNEHQYLKFPQMTSYHRMLVHRVSAFFGLDHNVDQSGKCVVVNRTANTRLPDFRFNDHISKSQGSQEEQPKKQILQRKGNSLDDGHGGAMSLDKKSKSFEEREEEYEKARARIFNQQDQEHFLAQNSQSSQEGLLESPMNGSQGSTRASSARSSKEDIRWSEGQRPWSSTDSSGYGTDNSYNKNKIPMTKASSFGGMTHRDSRTNRSFSKTESVSSGASGLGSPMPRSIVASSPPVSQLSESSSQSSGPSATSPQPITQDCLPAGMLPPFTPLNVEGCPPLAVWVASTLDSIPHGSIMINPQTGYRIYATPVLVEPVPTSFVYKHVTGKPYRNPDGSIYHYQPQVPSQVVPVLTSQIAQATGHMMGQALPAQQVNVQYQHADQNSVSGDSSGSDLTQSFSGMSLIPQSSQESLTQEPSSGQQVYMVPQPNPTQQVQQAATFVQSHQGYIHNQQVPYSTSQPNSQVRYVCPPVPYQPGQGQVMGSASDSQLPGQSQVAPQQNGQQPASQYPGYPMMGLPNMTVTAIEYTQPSTYQPGQGTPLPNQMQEGTQVYGVHGATPMYMAQQGSDGHTMSFQPQTPTAGQVYPPRTPPSQGPPAANQMVPQAIPVGQPMGSQPIYQQYGSFAGGQRSQSVTQVAAPAGQSVMLPQGATIQSYSMIRPGMQVGMQMPSQTTPPPQQQQTTPYPTVTMVSAPRLPLVETRLQKQSEMVLDNSMKSVVGGQLATTPTGQPLQLTTLQKIAVQTPGIRPLAALYRPQAQLGQEVRLLGQPIQQFSRPQLQPIIPMVTRSRTPVVNGQVNNKHKLRKPTKNGESPQPSPHNSTESMDSVNTITGNSCILEVYDLQLPISKEDTDNVFSDLISQGAHIQYLNNNKTDDCQALAMFDSDEAAQAALTNQSTKYRLRHATRQYQYTQSQSS